MSIGKRLNELREAKDWTLDDLADASDVSAPYISKLERDKALPKRPTLKALLAVLDPEALDVLLERDRKELEGLGYDPEVARIVVALEQLDPDTRERAVERLAADLAELLAEPDNGDPREFSDGSEDRPSRHEIAAR